MLDAIDENLWTDHDGAVATEGDVVGPQLLDSRCDDECHPTTTRAVLENNTQRERSYTIQPHRVPFTFCVAILETKTRPSEESTAGVVLPAHALSRQRSRWLQRPAIVLILRVILGHLTRALRKAILTILPLTRIWAKSSGLAPHCSISLSG
jgi:hypothetical protein